MDDETKKKFGLNLTAMMDLDAMDPEAVKALKGMEEEINTKMEEFLKDSVSKEDVKKSIDSAISDLKEKELKKQADQLVEYKDYLFKMKAASEITSDGKIAIKPISTQIQEQLKGFVKNGKVDLKGACKSNANQRKTIDLIVETKDAGIITSAGLAPYLSTTIDPVLSVNPREKTILRDVANVTTINSRSLIYAEYVSGEGDAEWVPEGGLKPLMDASIREVTVHAGKVALGAKFTEETLMDFPQLVAEIEAEVINKIGIREEQGILSGSGTNGEIVGILQDIPRFSLTGLGVRSANMYDALVAAYTQIVSNSNEAYRPNLVLVNPIDYATMQLTKDASGGYLRPFNNVSELIPGMRVISSTAVAQGTFFMGDFSYLNIRDYMSLTIEFGWENDDFRKNLVLMIAEKRLMAYIKKQYITAFVYDEFDNVIEVIDNTPEGEAA